MKSNRCEEVIVQLIVREHDELGRPIGEKISQPVKMFRAASLNFWTEIDKSVAAMTNAAAPSAGKSAEKGKKR